MQNLNDGKVREGAIMRQAKGWKRFFFLRSSVLWSVFPSFLDGKKFRIWNYKKCDVLLMIIVFRMKSACSTQSRISIRDSGMIFSDNTNAIPVASLIGVHRLCPGWCRTIQNATRLSVKSLCYKLKPNGIFKFEFLKLITYWRWLPAIGWPLMGSAY